MNKIKLVDCTVRDGGHLNNWDFSAECVKESYDVACRSNIDFFEIGYRNYENANYGKFYSCDDNFLMDVIQPNENCKIAVMADMTKSDINLFKTCDKNVTPISAVFVATYLKDLEESFIFCEKLFDKGYMVFLNLMAIYDYTDKDFEILKEWKNKHILESVCFADSFGSFLPDDVENIYNRLKLSGFKNISFHSHNNIQMAFANTLKAMDLGFYSVDASVYGMGRDAGNLPMELLLYYLNKFNENYNPIHYLKLIEKYYLDMHNKLNWGYNVYSFLGGIKNIHPKYIKELSQSGNIEKICYAADLLKQNNVTAYNKSELDKILLNQN